METFYSPTLTTSLSNKHLLLDTNVFRDFAAKPSVFTKFFNELKEADVTIATIDLVKYEILKGSASETKYQEKSKLIADIIDSTITPIPRTFEIIYELIQEYGIDGASLNVTDLFLGAILKQYKRNIFLMTRDTTDFIQSVFDLTGVVNVPLNKGIFTYGVYQYTK
ncbi:MAG: hypothetical protein UU16_C0046G0010 [Candidatus Woesebacteria bacterium GW2011_GWA2_40_7]|uniref:PIN domain-containing protein n=3 Tax=Candidatus Woeseibacteriota TaxID=1752722 RepID=A0A0G0UXD6_9BACT|nr:MAG: hypothetical protein UT17_C0006G0009 [Candidatus Woesebacteria bacterium GW2011_GWB1_39_10]KKR72096.1 MAG: hypothetical protein UU16_C0046G0010 [Candidatus Woesebacteria bacterium GW2011_GWA2_40_7]KKR92141.1 MAG: hypothetical protein UU42_C0003G0010 [Candidatus Woesebacteria bacterium GW2011_GWA1_41_13b]